MQDILHTIAVWAIPMIFAITMHEAAHGLAAKLCGDPTAWYMGRVTPNPIPHIDPVGTILVPGLLLLGSSAIGGGGLLFGWAKPVPVNVRNLRNPRRDMMLVSIAGPASNLLMAILWALSFYILDAVDCNQKIFYEMIRAGILGNIALMALNLIPIPPLDGSRVIAGFLPYRAAAAYFKLERWGMLIMVGLIMSGLLQVVFAPLMQAGLWIVDLFL